MDNDLILPSKNKTTTAVRAFRITISNSTCLEFNQREILNCCGISQLVHIKKLKMKRRIQSKEQQKLQLNSLMTNVEGHHYWILFQLILSHWPYTAEDRRAVIYPSN